MKKYISVLFVLLSFTVLAQIPQGVNYQSIARDGSGNPITNTAVEVRFRVVQNATTIYEETHNPTTNDFGLINLELGNGTILSGNFNTIDWNAGQVSVAVFIDNNLLGTRDMWSVPYSMTSAVADSVKGVKLSDVGSLWTENGANIYRETGNVGIGGTNVGSPLTVSSPGGGSGITQVSTTGVGQTDFYIDGAEKSIIESAGQLKINANGVNDVVTIDDGDFVMNVALTLNAAYSRQSIDTILLVAAPNGSVKKLPMRQSFFENPAWEVNGSDVNRATGKVGIGTNNPESLVQIGADFHVLDKTELGFNTLATNLISDGAGDVWYQTDGSAALAVIDPNLTGFFLYGAGSSGTTPSDYIMNLKVTPDGVSIGGDGVNASLDMGDRADGIVLPKGDDAERPTTPESGYLRYHTINNKFEGYDGTAWVNFGGSGSSPWTVGSGEVYTTDRVGIGASPSGYDLDIRNTADAELNISSSGAAIGTLAAIRLSMNDGYTGTVYKFGAEKPDGTANSGQSDFFFDKEFSTGGGYLRFLKYDNSSNDVIINESKTAAAAFGDFIVANGNVGIGTNAPSSAIHILAGPPATTRATGVMVDVNQTLTDAKAYIRFSQDGGSLQNPFFVGSDFDNGLNEIWAEDGTPICFGVDNIETMRIDGVGKVGIGTNSPDALLHLQGGGLLINGTIGVTPVSGVGTRMMWVPNKSSFRAGRVATTQWDDVNIGTYSFAVGSNTTASGVYSSALGNNCTSSNTAAFSVGTSNQANGSNSVALGNGSRAEGLTSFAMGTGANAAGDYSVAIGRSINSNANGTFSIRDATTGGFNNSIENRFMALFSGGYALFSNATFTSGVGLPAGATSWQTISDSTLKENFQPVNSNVLLEEFSGMKLGTWNYKANDDSKRHYGPMAQDFDRIFGNDEVGHIGSDTAIFTQDISGVNMTLIQALLHRSDQKDKELENKIKQYEMLLEKNKEQDVLIQGLKAELDLKTQLIEKRLQILEAKDTIGAK